MMVKVIAGKLTNIKQTGDEEVSFQKAINTLKDAQLNFVGSERTQPDRWISSIHALK